MAYPVAFEIFSSASLSGASFRSRVTGFAGFQNSRRLRRRATCFRRSWQRARTPFDRRFLQEWLDLLGAGEQLLLRRLALVGRIGVELLDQAFGVGLLALALQREEGRNHEGQETRFHPDYSKRLIST
jgi:hypothetical protein